MRNALVAMVCLLLSAASQAAPVEWELNNIQMWDPGYNLDLLSGSFIYDADTHAVTSIGFSGATIVNPTVLTHGFDVYGDGSAIVFTETVVSSELELSSYVGSAMIFGFTDALTNAGGVTTLVEGEGPGPLTLLDNPSSMAGCWAGDECHAYGVYFLLDQEDYVYTGGTLVGTVVPIPAAVWLFGSALAGLGWMRRKQTV
jgi:hypothetical protein